MSWWTTPIGRAAQGTVIALLTWLALYLAKEHLGRTAALILAVVVLLIFVLVLLARVRHKTRDGSKP